jgi:hypothetical protein
MTDLLAVPAQWVTLRAQTEEGLPLVVLVDQAVATTAPYAEHPVQVAGGVPYPPGEDGLPAAEDQERLREMEQYLVDAGAGRARLVAVMTLEGVREWTFYARDTAWTEPLKAVGLSVLETQDPAYQGLRELAGLGG